MVVLEGSDILQLREAAEAERLEKERKREDVLHKKNETKENYIRCKEE